MIKIRIFSPFSVAKKILPFKILIPAINMLRDKPPGTFIVRDSNSFPGAFGLALKVATPPPGVHPGLFQYIKDFFFHSIK